MKGVGMLGLKGCIPAGELEREVVDLYERSYRERFSVDRLLCRPTLAMEFAVRIRLGLDVEADSLPDFVILEELVNARKRGKIKQGGAE